MEPSSATPGTAHGLEQVARAAAGTRTVVVMGVSGNGKTTIGKALAERQGWPFAEGDQFHPAENVAKMSQGIPLDDDDRWPWLRTIAEWIGEQEAAGRSAVVACSALKRSYRDLLRAGHPSVWFAHVLVPVPVLEERLRRRTGHYMPPSLLPTQLATLEPLQADERGAEFADQGTPGATLQHLLGLLDPEIIDPETVP